MKRKTVFKGLRIPDDRRIQDLWIAPWASATVTAAIETGIMEILAKLAATPQALAKANQLHEESVVSVLRILVAMGFAKQLGQKFHLTADAQAYLVPSSTLSRLEELSVHFETKEHKFMVRKLKETIPQYTTFGALWKDQPQGNAFVQSAARGMDSIIKAPAIAVIRTGAFKGVEHVLDVGGGSGAFAVALTEQQPKTRVTVLDLPAMCEQARQIVESRSSHNINFHPADFFRDPWAEGCDAVFFSNVLHDWPEEQVQQLLDTSYDVLVDRGRRRGRIYILEVLRQRNRNGPLMATLFHMHMQMGFGGAQYTRSDFARILSKSGFGPPRVLAKFGYYSLLMASKK